MYRTPNLEMTWKGFLWWVNINLSKTPACKKTMGKDVPFELVVVDSHSNPGIKRRGRGVKSEKRGYTAMGRKEKEMGMKSECRGRSGGVSGFGINP